MMTSATILEHDGITQSITEWALDYGITPGIIIGRLERGLTVADAITKPMQIGYRGQKLASPDMEAFIFANERRSRRVRVSTTALRRHQAYTHNGKSLTIAGWSVASGVKAPTIRSRLRAGLPIGMAISSTSLTRAELARKGGIEPRTVESRVRRGWTLDLALSEPPCSRMGRFAHGRPGAPSNFAPSKGTGAGRTAQETPNITFSGIDA